MSSDWQLPFRHIHLDFHTSPGIPGVGEDFDADQFAATLADAHVNSITVFAKCHHGMAYYPTRVGVAHPGLAPGQDLLGEMIEAGHRRGIRVAAYLSTLYDQQAWVRRGDWRALRSDGTEQGHRGVAGPLTPGLGRLCANTGYLDELSAMTEEVLKTYRPDGVFFDNFLYEDDDCCCASCMAERRKLGLGSANPAQRRQHIHDVMARTMRHLAAISRSVIPDGTVYVNGVLRLREDGQFMREVLPAYTHVEIESLPGGLWGYDYFPMAVRRLRNLGLETMGMTGAFHRSWGDFGSVRSQAALDYECFSMLAHGVKCSVGDHLHPRGTLNAEIYRRIGVTFAGVEEKEPWCAGARAVTEIAALLTDDDPDADRGVTQMLTQLGHQFDLVDGESDWEAYRVLILPDSRRIDTRLGDKLTAFLANGGKILASGDSGLSIERKDFAIPLGVDYVSAWPWQTQYADFGGGVQVLYEPGHAVTARPAATVLATSWRPYFDNDYQHFQVEQPPFSEATEYAAAVTTDNTAYIAAPIFRTYARHGYPVYRDLVAAMLAQLLPDPLVQASGPTTLQVTVTEQPGRRIVHLLHYVPERRAPNQDVVEDVLPVRDVALRVRVPERPSAVYLAPRRQAVEFDYSSGYARLTVPEVRGHQMVVFDNGDSGERSA
jgi:hypothetical protein